jgi:putative effector of murein hydrolase
MKANSRTAWPLIAAMLLLFIIVAAIGIWYVNPLTEQSAFGFLLSAELIAFSMLVYTYTKNSSSEFGQVSRIWLLIGFVALFVLVLLSVTMPA